MQGCLLLGAVGDAFGYVIEFDSLSVILRRFEGPLPFARRDLWADETGRHIVSDDTQMTLFTAEACAVALDRLPCDLTKIIPSESRLAYFDWYHTQTGKWHEEKDGKLVSFPELFAERAPGMTCLTALRDGGFGSVAQPINDSKGCGGVMRVAPIAFVPGLDDNEAWTVACEVAAITHGHVLGWASAGALVHILRSVLVGQSVADAARQAIAFMRGRSDCGAMPDVLEGALRFAGLSKITPEEIEMLGGGWVGEECLAIAIAAAVLDMPVHLQLEAAANHSGDSDSTASVAGQLLGALHGRAALNAQFGLQQAFIDLDVARPMQATLDRFGRAIRNSAQPPI